MIRERKIGLRITRFGSHLLFIFIALKLQTHEIHYLLDREDKKRSLSDGCCENDMVLWWQTCFMICIINMKGMSSFWLVKHCSNAASHNFSPNKTTFTLQMESVNLFGSDWWIFILSYSLFLSWADCVTHNL